MLSIFLISEGQFDRLCSAKVFVRNRKNAYDLPTSIKNFVAYHAAGQSSGTVAEEKRLLTIAQRKRIEQETAFRAGDLVDRGDVERLFLATVTALAAQLDGLAGRLAHELSACTDPAIARAVLLREHRRVRESYAKSLGAFVDAAASRTPADTTTTTDGDSMG
jgi:hypothetical protein